jgi:hypothetical protein
VQGNRGSGAILAALLIFGRPARANLDNSGQIIDKFQLPPRHRMCPPNTDVTISAI